MFNRKDKTRIAELELQLEIAGKLIRETSQINRCVDVRLEGKFVTFTFVCNGQLFDYKFMATWDFDLSETRMQLGLAPL
jgi:hypothetical protein